MLTPKKYGGNQCMKLIFQIFILLFTTGNIIGQTTDEDFIANYIARHKSITTLSCTFKQIKSSDLFQEDQVALGKLFMKNQAQIRWEYTSPQKKIILLKNNLIISQDANGKINKYNFLDNPFIGKGFKLFEALANGHLFDSDKFTAKVSLLNTQQPHITLIPQIKQLRKYINALEITVDSTTYLVQKIIINEASGDQTTIHFSSCKINETMNNALFTLEK